LCYAAISTSPRHLLNHHIYSMHHNRQVLSFYLILSHQRISYFPLNTMTGSLSSISVILIYKVLYGVCNVYAQFLISDDEGTRCASCMFKFIRLFLLLPATSIFGVFEPIITVAVDSVVRRIRLLAIVVSVQGGASLLLRNRLFALLTSIGFLSIFRRSSRKGGLPNCCP
jgi:hypothetical protein